MVGLGDFPGGNFSSSAAAVSANGAVVVGIGDPANPVQGEAFRWTAATGLVGLGDLAGGFINSVAVGVSADGLVVVGQSDSALGAEAFRWTAATGMVALGDLPGGFFSSAALAASADGSIVVGWSNTGGPVLEEAFIWDPLNGMRNLRDVLIAQGDDLTGWRLEQATGISADGTTIVGWGRNPAGQIEGWVATLGPAVPIPEPASLVLALLAGLGSLAGLAKRRGTDSTPAPADVVPF
jgi:probable HAF family extracellular repeat protein